MIELKYVVTDQQDFAIFTALTKHSDIGHRLHGKPVGAGFCTIRQEADSTRVNVHCYGNSVSLQLESREEDEQIINDRINRSSEYL